MPQRQFWATQHPTEVVIKIRVDPNDPGADPLTTFSCLDQAGATMAWAGGRVPAGFMVWAMADAIRAGLEAWDASTPDDAGRAFQRTLEEWRKSARLAEPLG